MARLKEYDREEVLENASTLFWRKGFEATSMANLVETTGLNSASMYKEFGSKEGLYDAALVHYQESWLERFIAILSNNPDWKGVRAYLSALLESSTQQKFNGCLMINTIAEANVVSTKAITRVEKFCIRLQSMLVKALRNAQEQGDIPKEKHPEILANYIICFMHGLVLYGRLKGNRKNIPEIVKTLMTSIAQ